VCQRNKTGHLHLVDLLQPLAVPTGVWCDIVLDFVEGFPKVDGKLVILTVGADFLNTPTSLPSATRTLQ
jgi:hypothetical protein